MPQSDDDIERARDVGDPAQWEKGELRRAKDVSVTLSFRAPMRLVNDIEAFAVSHQLSVSDVLRRAVEHYLESSATPTYSNTYFSVVGTTWNASLRTGGPTTMRSSGTLSGGSETIPPGSRMPLFERAEQLGVETN